MNKASLILENGLCMEGMSFGYDGPCEGELVFSTAMVGYPESLTDPSYEGQILCVSYPIVGNYGIPAMTRDEWGVCLGFESEKIHVRGLVISDYSGKFSHYDAVKSLGRWLRDEHIPAICGIDTRHLTQLLRDNGTLAASIAPLESVRSTDGIPPQDLRHPRQATPKIERFSGAPESNAHGGAERSGAVSEEILPCAVSIDLITGVPGMTIEILERTVEEVIGWRPEHISAYQLSIEEGSALARMIEKGEVRELGEDECREQYDYMCRRLAEAGYHHYEISNWALPGHEAIHNSAYWTRHPYVGLGPGAHSLIGNRRSWNSQELSGWMPEGEDLTAEQIHEEEVMLLSRTDKGPIPERDWFIADEIILDLL